MQSYRSLAAESWIQRFFGAIPAKLQLLSALLLVLFVMTNVAHAQRDRGRDFHNPAEAFIQQSVDRGYSILANDKVSRTERQKRFRGFLLNLMDARRIAMFTLGRYANQATPRDIDEFTDAFANYVVAVYATRLSKYQGEKLEVSGSTSQGRDEIIVNCNIIDPMHPDAMPFRVAFRVRPGGNEGFLITDLNVEGIWQTITQRDEFNGFLQQHGGSVKELTEELQRKTREMNNAR